MRKKLIKNLICFAAACLLSFCAVTGCSSFGDIKETDDSIKVLFITDTNDTFRKKLTDAIVAEATSQGITLDVVETGENSDKELELVKAASSKGYKAILCIPTNSANALQLDSAVSGIPIVYLNNQPGDDHLTPDKYIYVGSDESQAGKYQAEFVIEKLGKTSMNVIIFQGEKNHPAAVKRTAAVKDTLQAHGINANYVFVDSADWSEEDAADKFAVYMKTGHPVDAIFCNNDTMALGVIAAIKAHGLDPSSILVCGIDASDEARESILAGELAFTVFQDADTQAKRAVEAAKLLATGSTLETIPGISKDRKYIWVDFTPIDASNAKE